MGILLITVSCTSDQKRDSSKFENLNSKAKYTEVSTLSNSEFNQWMAANKLIPEGPPDTVIVVERTPFGVTSSPKTCPISCDHLTLTGDIEMEMDVRFSH